MSSSICRSVGLSILALQMLAWNMAHAQEQKPPIRIGVLTDLSGSLSNSNGRGSIIAAELAAEDFGGMVNGRKIEIISADHQNKADVGAAIARRWLETEQVAAIVDVPNSAVAFAVSQIVRDRNKVLLASGPSSSDFTGKACSPNTVQWTLDTWMLSNVVGNAAVKSGMDSFFFITADYSFGQALARDLSAVITSQNGKVLGNARHPINTSDFSSYLLQASSSRSKAVALLNVGSDTINAIKQAAEYRLTASGQRLVAVLLSATEIHALGLKVAQGLIYAEPFYWDLNPSTRQWSERFSRRQDGVKPNSLHAGAYSAVVHYLKSIAAGGDADDGAALVLKMKALPTDDAVFGKGEVRIDGRKIHPVYVEQVKAPADSKEPWDVATVLETIPGDKAFRPLIEECPLVKAKN